MPKFIVLGLVILSALALPSVAMAQSPATISAADGNTSGVITVIQVDADTKLVGFMLSTQNGDQVVVSVDDDTSFGLENGAGDRWISDFGADPTEALLRITDQRERFAPVTVTVIDGVASAVVDREQGDLERNLGFLFAVYLVTWAGFFAYIFIVSRRQSDLAREIDALRAQISGSTTPESAG